MLVGIVSIGHISSSEQNADVDEAMDVVAMDVDLGSI